MKTLRVIILLIVAAVLPVSSRAQTQPAAPAPEAQAAPPAAQGNILRITSPKTGEQLQQSFVNVQFRLVNQAASASATPNFEVTLDSRDPVTTSSTSYTFDGLTPGKHTVTVQLVDANGTPVPGARAEAQFVVMRPPAPTPSAAIALPHQRSLIAASLRIEPPEQEAKTKKLSSAAGSLPLLSVIGFGVLLGGIASAMRTRPK